MINASVRHAFNRAAKTYDQACTPQSFAAMCLLRLMQSETLHPHAVLDLGAGTGIFSRLLLDKRMCKIIFALDFAGKLLSQIKGSEFSLIQASYDYIPLKRDTFDCLTANMALQWSEHLPTTLKEINRVMSQGAQFLFSIPLPGTFSQLKQHLPNLAAQIFYDAKTIETMLREAGFTVMKTDSYRYEDKYTDLLSALRSIKKVGADYVKKPNHSHRLSKTTLRRKNKNVIMDYHIGCFLAEKVST